MHGQVILGLYFLYRFYLRLEPALRERVLSVLLPSCSYFVRQGIHGAPDDESCWTLGLSFFFNSKRQSEEIVCVYWVAANQAQGCSSATSDNESWLMTPWSKE